MDRRTFLRTASVGTIASFAGCSMAQRDGKEPELSFKHDGEIIEKTSSSTKIAIQGSVQYSKNSFIDDIIPAKTKPLYVKMIPYVDLATHSADYAPKVKKEEIGPLEAGESKNFSSRFVITNSFLEKSDYIHDHSNVSFYKYEILYAFGRPIDFTTAAEGMLHDST
ncbi:MAG: hypothetical protein ABEJ55_01135 [Halanaeroarchaeum sp.]